MFIGWVAFFLYSSAVTAGNRLTRPRDSRSCVIGRNKHVGVSRSCSGGTVFVWRTWGMRWSSCGRGTGGSSACREPWKRSVDEGLSAGWVQRIRPCRRGVVRFLLTESCAVTSSRHSLSQEPVLSKEQPAFQYSSHVSLQAPSGHMWCVYPLFPF